MKVSKQFYLGFIALLFFIFCAANTVADNEALSPEQTNKIRRLSDLRLSPDGSKIVFTVSEPVKGTSQNRDIWVYDIQKKELRQFTYEDKSDSSPRWSPDGKQVAFLSSREDKTQIYLISIDGGEACALTRVETGVSSFAWSPDGGRIAYLAREPQTDEEKKKKEAKDDARVIQKNEKHSCLWVIDLDSKEIDKLTKNTWRISGFTWMPGGDGLILSATDHPQPELFSNRIYRLRIDEGEMESIFQPQGPFGNLRVSPDGKYLAYVGSRADGPTANDLFIRPLSGKRSRNLTQDSIDRTVSSFCWTKEGTLLALVQDGFLSVFYTIDLKGRAEKQNTFPITPSRSFVAGEDILAFVGAGAVAAPELWIYSQPGKAVKVTNFNRDWDGIKLIKPEIITYKSNDGKKIEAALLLPEGYHKGSRVPLVVLVHGGPSGRWSDSFNSWGQLLAARGYAVLCPNIRGSVGYGYEFLTSNRYDWGGGDFKDVMAGVDYLIKRGIADPERLGVGGWSYGGYMAAWAVTQTDRFAASVSGAPMTDLAVEYGTETSSINAYDTWYLGTPYENPDLFIKRSPTTYIKDVQTPTMILCGENDHTDPIGQCYIFHRGLKRYSVDTEFIVYPREGHGLSEEKHRIDVLNRMLNWFAKYLE
jgi:dipeptidyl aminopeptidase/acylaminoacyl peptidase